MKTRSIVIYAIVFAVLGAVICLTVLKGSGGGAVPHTTEINRLLISLADDWESISAGNGFDGGSTEFDYAVIDSDGDLLFVTRQGISETLSAATGHYDIIRDIEIDGEVAGRLLVYNDSDRLRKAERESSARMIGGMSALMLIFSLGYFIYLKKIVVEPFGKLRGFAEKVASGDLDTPLEMDRSNIFGAFTESFDIMRQSVCFQIPDSEEAKGDGGGAGSRYKNAGRFHKGYGGVHGDHNGGCRSERDSRFDKHQSRPHRQAGVEPVPCHARGAGAA